MTGEGAQATTGYALERLTIVSARKIKSEVFVRSEVARRSIVLIVGDLRPSSTREM